MRIPSGPDDLTNDWLTGALREGNPIDKAAVVSFKTRPVSEGAYGQIARLSLDYEPDEPGAPRSLIAKFSSATPEMRTRPNTVAAYEREVRFYQRLADRTSLPTPTCYYGDVDTETGMHVLLLEDLGTGPRVTDCSPDQARTAVSHIAGFHAAWWEKPQLEGLTWLADVDFDPVELHAAHDRWWPEFLTKAGHRLPGPLRETGKRLGEHRADIMRHLRSIRPRTLCHGDYSHGNLIFGTPEGGVPFAVIDWQLMHRGRGVEDVAYFLCRMQPEDRLAVEMDLLEVYHQILEENGVREYTFDQCLHDYRLSLLNRFGSLISTIAAMPFTPEQIQNTIDVLVPRISAAILDHNAGELLE